MHNRDFKMKHAKSFTRQLYMSSKSQSQQWWKHCIKQEKIYFNNCWPGLRYSNIWIYDPNLQSDNITSQIVSSCIFFIGKRKRKTMYNRFPISCISSQFHCFSAQESSAGHCKGYYCMHLLNLKWSPFTP